MHEMTLNLTDFKLPRNLSPKSAQRFAMSLAGMRRETDFVRYLALSLHYGSWRLPVESNLLAYADDFDTMDSDSSETLLDMLSQELVFKLRGAADGLPSGMVRAAQAVASSWRQQIKARSVDVPRLHHRMLDLLREVLAAEAQPQAMLVAELQSVLLYEESESAPAASPAQAQTTLFFALPPGDPRGAAAFSSPEALTAYLKHALTYHSTRLGPEPPTVLTPPPEIPDPLADVTSKVQVFEPADAFAVLRALPPPSPHEGNNQQRSVLERMSADTGRRALTEVPEGQPLAELYRHFPHFTAVLDLVARSLALAACGDAGSPVRIPPILLRGAPGVGKTYFAQELARVLGSHFVEKDLSVLSEAFVISGMDPSWKGSKPGVVFDTVVSGKTANPLICLNEVDKAKVTGTNNSPLAALYALLEPTSAENYRDEYLPVTFNASNIVWVLTANDGHIPEPILHRLEVFDIPQPTQAQCQAVALSVWEAVCRKTLPSGHGFPLELPLELLTVVSAVNPREMRKMLTRAVGQAAFCGRKHLLRDDLNFGKPSASSASRSIGFLTA